MNGANNVLTATGALALVALATPWMPAGRWRVPLSGAAVALLGLAGAGAGLAVMAGATPHVTVALSLPVPPLTFAPDPLGGFFMVVIGLVAAVTAVFGVGYARTGAAGKRLTWTGVAALVACLLAVPACADAVSFLLAWELMALVSTGLVLTEHAGRPEVRTAGVWYAVMAHVSFVGLLLGFAVLAGAAGSTSFTDFSAVDPSSPAAVVAFVLLAVGFAAKAGIVPLHVWLPRAHPAAPSHVSALLSAALVKLGVYGLMLVALRLIPGGPAWEGVLLMVAGGLSALFGVLQASVTADLKRLLAYSTTENIGLMVLAIGVAMVLVASGATAMAGAAAVACLLLVVGHAAMKTTAFLAAGIIHEETGQRDLDALGGLARRMPATAVGFGVASLGAAALPVTGGFVAEWSLLQVLIHGSIPGNQLVQVAMPVAVVVVALATGVALMTFVKAFGMGFLARPRSEPAARAHEAGPTMIAALLVGAAAVVVTGLVPGVVAEGAAGAVGADVVGTTTAAGLELLPFTAILDPAALTVLMLALAAVVGVATVIWRRTTPRREVELAWACGLGELSPRMEYTATSYAEPLTRVFDDVLQQSRDLDVTHAEESRYFVTRAEFSHRVGDAFETRLYAPLLRVLDRLGRLGSRLQTGSVHRYLLYSFLGLLAVLVVARP